MDELGNTRVYWCEGSKDVTDYDVLLNAIKGGLSDIAEMLNNKVKKLSDFRMEMFREKPDKILIKHFCNCCWEQCPFCGAVCTNSQKDHPGDHNADFHRTAGIKGSAYRNTEEISIDFCTTLVASAKFFYPESSQTKIPCKQYKTAGGAYANWLISTDLSEKIYWKWFICEFQEHLEAHYSGKFCGVGKSPNKWRSYSQMDAVKSLKIHQ